MNSKKKCSMRKIVKTILNRGFFNPIGLSVERQTTTPYTYDQDGLKSVHNCDFMHEQKFSRAYERGVSATESDFPWHWRVHVGLWVASVAARLKAGSFVECGVNRGFLSSAIMDYLDWNSLDRQFYLFDTFEGLVPRQLSEEETKLQRLEVTNQLYYDCYDLVVENFKEYHNVHIVKGEVPATLETVDISSVAYLSLDMNCAYPEIEAIKYFWPRMVDGGLVILDDYAYQGYEPQKKAFDIFARENDIDILTLPTGQGLMIKTP